VLERVQDGGQQVRERLADAVPASGEQVRPRRQRVLDRLGELELLRADLVDRAGARRPDVGSEEVAALLMGT
jgi:hypothetical protein